LNKKAESKRHVDREKTHKRRQAGKKADDRNLDEKKKLTLEVIRRLKQEYPEAKCTLDYDKAWQLLVSVRLAAQCTDARVDQITPKLYEKFPSVAALAAAEPEEIEEIVRPCGLGKSKARDISACMRVLHEQYNDQVPDDFDALLKLPGVGRKTANLLLGDLYSVPGSVVCDTHCIRICGKLGLTDGTKDPAKCEDQLRAVLPPAESSDFCHRIVLHGRAVCTARKPACERCSLAPFCDYFNPVL
jgi:endonuclease-3